VSWKVLALDRTNSTAIKALYRIGCTLWPMFFGNNNVNIVKIAIGACVGTITAKVCLTNR